MTPSKFGFSDIRPVKNTINLVARLALSRSIFSARHGHNLRGVVAVLFTGEDGQEGYDPADESSEVREN